jgi:hypothetical protein
MFFQRYLVQYIIINILNTYILEYNFWSPLGPALGPGTNGPVAPFIWPCVRIKRYICNTKYINVRCAAIYIEDNKSQLKPVPWYRNGLFREQIFYIEIINV